MQDLREELRKPKNGTYSLAWRDRNGNASSVEARGIDASKSGVGVECLRELKPGLLVYVQAKDGSVEGEGVVVHCTPKGLRFHIGLELREEVAPEPKKSQPGKGARQSVSGNASSSSEEEIDYYETLQISPFAELETIHRVFRIMALRFHPDNPETGDVEEFIRLKTAYAVLSDADKRAEYDNQRTAKEQNTMPIFELKDFVTGVEAESNRRLGILSLLYNQRRINPDHPGVSLLDLEKRMGFPREYLTFSTWYLRSKNLITVADNSDYALTAPGCDYVEENAPRNEIVNKLIKIGPSRAYRPSSERSSSERPPAPKQPMKYLEEHVDTVPL